MNSGGDINYRLLQQGSSFDRSEAFEDFLWCKDTKCRPYHVCFQRAKLESTLEYAITFRHEDIALCLVSWGCLLTGRQFALAAVFGMDRLLRALFNHGWCVSDKERVGRNCLRHALRCGHDSIVGFLLEEGISFREGDLYHALKCWVPSTLSTEVQLELARATPIEQWPEAEPSWLELCCIKFTVEAVTDILRHYPSAYDSGALSAIVLRGLQCPRTFSLHLTNLRTMVSRRTGSRCDWDKENTAVLIAATLTSPEALRILIPQGSAFLMRTARLSLEHFDKLLGYRPFTVPHRSIDSTHHWIDSTESIFYGQSIACSPLVGLTTTRDNIVNWDVSEEMLDYLLACSYEPDALTVVMAAANGKLRLLRRFQCLMNWKNLLRIEEQGRLPWCPTALQAATINGRGKVVDFLLDAGVGVNESAANERIGRLLPRTAFQAAVATGNLRLADRFIERGACINAPPGENAGATALQLACIHGYLTISLRLLELGADVNARGAGEKGRTALEGAAEHGRIDTIQLLFNHGVCTEGAYREQYLKAVLYAEDNRHFAAAALLREQRTWTSEDEECYKNIRSVGM